MNITSPTTPAALLLQELVKRHLTVATAESCTGGNIAHLITEVAGASEAMLGGVVSYSNEVKARLLGVSTDDLERHGAVSRAVVAQMAAGRCLATGACCAMASCGVAGPGGGGDSAGAGGDVGGAAGGFPRAVSASSGNCRRGPG